MKPIHLKQNKTPDKRPSSLSAKVTDNQDTRYDYLMLLTNEWIASQKNNYDFIRSINLKKSVESGIIVQDIGFTVL